MAFKVDKQSINDLKMIGSTKGQDVFTHYNKSQTRGGAKILKDMFLYPLSRKEDITSRVARIKYCRDNNVVFPFDNKSFDHIDFYLSNIDQRTQLKLHDDNLKRKFTNLIGAQTDYQQIYAGVLGVLNFLIDIKVFNTKIAHKDAPNFFMHAKFAQEILNKPALAFIKGSAKIKKLSYAQTVELDELFRFTVRSQLLELLNDAYYLDVYVAVAEVGTAFDFVFAEAINHTENNIRIKGMYHPLIANAVPNDLSIDETSNMIFLTGANMAGKSTFMKTFGIVMYLAHMGFPLPVESMQFSVQNGMFTTINLADDVNTGFSHFYAEVFRVKKVAQSIHKNDRLVVIFDELFRGTNVKDAYDATIAIMEAFADKRNCTFIISTHIIEAGEVLKNRKKNIKFLYLPTVMEQHKPKYTYSIKEGISSDRHGMVIIENEKILEILKK